jgi:hypothetical protein
MNPVFRRLAAMAGFVVMALAASWLLLSPPTVVATTVDSPRPTRIECGTVVGEAFGDAVTVTDTGPVTSDADRKCQARARLELIAVPSIALVTVISIVLVAGRLRRKTTPPDGHLVSA